jgi:hypothetical protein
MQQILRSGHTYAYPLFFVDRSAGSLKKLMILPLLLSCRIPATRGGAVALCVWCVAQGVEDGYRLQSWDVASLVILIDCTCFASLRRG